MPQHNGNSRAICKFVPGRRRVAGLFHQCHLCSRRRRRCCCWRGHHCSWHNRNWLLSQGRRRGHSHALRLSGDHRLDTAREPRRRRLTAGRLAVSTGHHRRVTALECLWNGRSTAAAVRTTASPQTISVHATRHLTLAPTKHLLNV